MRMLSDQVQKLKQNEENLLLDLEQEKDWYWILLQEKNELSKQIKGDDGIGGRRGSMPSNKVPPLKVKWSSSISIDLVQNESVEKKNLRNVSHLICNRCYGIYSINEFSCHMTSGCTSESMPSSSGEVYLRENLIQNLLRKWA
jgi:hypothetical protein